MKKLLFSLVLLMGANTYATCDNKADELALKNAIRSTTLGSEGDAYWDVFSIDKPFIGEVNLETISNIIKPDYLDEITGSELSDNESVIEFIDDKLENLEYDAEEDVEFYILEDIKNYKTTKETLKKLFGDKFYFLEVFEGDEDDGIGTFEKIIFGVKPNGCIIAMRSAEFWT